MLLQNSFKEKAMFVSDKLPKGKALYIPKRIIADLNLKNHQCIYLIINEFVHPAVLVKRNVTIPLKLRKLVENNKNIKIFVKPVIGREETEFLASFRPININDNFGYYYIYCPKLIENNTKLKLLVKNKYFYGTSVRNRILLGKRIFKRLGLDSSKIYQFKATKFPGNTDNEHLFGNKLDLSSEDCVKNGNINLLSILPDFEISNLKNKIEIFYETRCKDSKKIKVNKMIKITPDLLRLLGLYQAEGTKTNSRNHICFTNNDPNQIKYFKEYFSNIFGIDDSLWRLEISSAKLQQEKLIKFWEELLDIKKAQICMMFKKHIINPLYGIANLKISNNTVRVLFYRLLKLMKQKILENKNFCGHFLSGVLAGDGYPQIEQNRIKRIELYFDPHKLYDEVFFYLDCLNFLNIKHHYMRISHQKHNGILKEKAEKIVNKIKKRFNNVKIQPKLGIYGVGGTIAIHRKEDISKLIPFRLFYPNIRHYNKVYKYWKK